jgi:hypothetical protein
MSPQPGGLVYPKSGNNKRNPKIETLLPLSENTDFEDMRRGEHVPSLQAPQNTAQHLLEFLHCIQYRGTHIALQSPPLPFW